MITLYNISILTIQKEGTMKSEEPRQQEKERTDTYEKKR